MRNLVASNMRVCVRACVRARALDSSLLQWWREKSVFCGLFHRVGWWLDTNVSDDRASSIYRAPSSETLVSYHDITRRNNSENHDFCVCVTRLEEQ